MRFRSTAKNAVVVVRAGDAELIPGTTRVRRIQPIRAEFKNFFFDSVAAQQKFRWTNEERELVEQSLIDHPDFQPPNPRLGRPRFYLVEDEARPITQEQATAEVERAPVFGCVYSWVGSNGDSEMCPRKALEGSDFCEEHSAVAATLGLEVADDDTSTDPFDLPLPPAAVAEVS